MNKYWIMAMLALAGCNGCKNNRDTTDIDYNVIRDDLIESSKTQHNAETQRINDFIAEKKWPMLQTPTGLHYWIYETGKGEKASEGKIADVVYSSSLLDGTLCYQTKGNIPSQILIGMDNVESGLHEALVLMHAGDKAKIILPSHLAFGFTGDSEKIPQNASVVYDLQLIALR